MNQTAKRKLENKAIVEGLAGPATPEMLDYFAHVLNTCHIFGVDRHEFFQGALNECGRDRRYAMYNAIVPRLNWKPLSLNTYECRIAEKAGAMVARRHLRVEGTPEKPIELGERKPEDAASATLICHKCKQQEKFAAETPVAAILKARDAGWVKTPGFDQESCPKCRRIYRFECKKCGEKLGAFSWSPKEATDETVTTTGIDCDRCGSRYEIDLDCSNA